MVEASNVKLQLIDAHENTNLHALAARGAIAELKQLDICAKIDQRNYFGWTPLMVAARYGHIETVQLLLQNKADASKTNKYEASVFLMAVASGNLDIVNILLEYLLSGGVSRRAIAQCISPLSLSILFQHEALAKFLLGKRFPVNAFTMNTGLTPLMFAAMVDNGIFHEHLLMNGADINARNAAGKTAQDLFCQRHANDGANYQMPQLQANIPSSPFIVINNRQMLSPSICYAVINPQMRKSSNVCTPTTPPPTISPLVHPQIFFPQDFSNSGCLPCNPEYVIAPFVTISSPAIDFLNICISSDLSNVTE